MTETEKWIEHMDRDAQTCGLPTYTELLATLRQAESLIDTLALACLDRVDSINDPRRAAITSVLNAAA